MLRALYFFLPKVYFSFPVQLLLNNFRRNQVLILCWIILFAMITGNFGRYLGIPYLFLDPEYLNRVDFTSFLIMGSVMAGFTTAFHITGYINDGHRFSFIGALPKPFTRFAVNNSLIPVAFLTVYLYEIFVFQVNNEYQSQYGVITALAGLITGYGTTILGFYIYFRFTNKDIFRYVVCRIDDRLKSTVKITRASALRKLDIARKKQVRVDYYWDVLSFRPVETTRFYDKATIVQVFDQNHFNLVIIELFIFVVVLILGVFKDNPIFQLPAAASFIIFLTIFVMLSGAFKYWFGGWSATMGLILFLLVNYLVGEDFFSRKYEAFGLNYATEPAPYNIGSLQQLNDSVHQEGDRRVTLIGLRNWRKKFGEEKPKMVFQCVSGGGKRAALWTLNALQHADSLTTGAFMRQTILVTGASGGLIGASYFRELKLRQLQGEKINPYAAVHRNRIATDNLNPLIFSLLANDLFVGLTRYEYGGMTHKRDRAYTFEEQLNEITEGLMDKPVSAYRHWELSGAIPTVLLTPTVVNDGRKLFIASRPVSFMNYDVENTERYTTAKYGGVDFYHLFRTQNGDSLRFLSALRMSATFPYITPNTTLPTNPPIQTMDAGISDNFGLSDAVRFLFAFKEWINENTSGVIFVSIRDSPKLGTIAPKKGQTIIDDITQPISSVYNNFENFQDITSDMLIGHANTWLTVPIDRVDLQYQAERYVPILQGMDSIRQNSTRASLSWRLTTREKQGIMDNIRTDRNREEVNKLKKLLE